MHGDVLDLDLSELLSLEVTSVTKQKQKLSESAAAVYVITADDIRRSGVSSIPEALRLAPGIQVGHIDSNKWSVSSRGFGGQFANDLLVLIDGRSVYTPSYSGVYWEIQDTVLEDIDRIEVVRGPGASLWGANAVNGIINIITKPAAQTQNGLLSANVGEEESQLSLRYGMAISEDVDGRFYFKYRDYDSSYAPDLDSDAGDDWDSMQAGFRLDGGDSQSSWTIQGDIYDADLDQIIQLDWTDPTVPPFLPRLAEIEDDIDASGWNLLARRQWISDSGNESTFQAYIDHTEREERLLDQEHTTLDLDFQQAVAPMGKHHLIWGLGYRYYEDDFDNSFSTRLIPDDDSFQIFSAFIQNEIHLTPDDLRLTLGSKFEHNDFTGFEVQPTARLWWKTAPGHSLWAAVSRAVRTPSRIEDSGLLVTGVFPPPPVPPGLPPIVVTTTGHDDFDSEIHNTLEIGYRGQPKENLSYDLVLFYSDYDKLFTIERTGLTETKFDNKGNATSYGLELVVDWVPVEWARLQAAYSYIDIDNDLDSDSNDVFTTAVNEGSAPEHKLTLRALMDLSDTTQLNLWLEYIDELDATSFTNPLPVDDYISFNLKFAWQATPDLELSLVGRNLLDDRHQEYVGENTALPTEVERSIYGQIRLDY